MRVRWYPYPGRVSLFDGGSRLLRRVRRQLGTGAFAEHAAGREQLDDRRPNGDLLACRAAHGVRSVGDATDLHPVAAGDRDATRRGDDAWTFDGAALDLLRELDDHRTVRAEVAHGRDAAAQSEAGVAERLERGGGFALPHLRVEVSAAVEREMRVAVDEAGDGKVAGDFQRSRLVTFGCLGHARPLADPGDLAVLDDDRRTGDRARAIEEAVDLQDRSHV